MTNEDVSVKHKSRRSRYIRHQHELLPIQLTERDLDILASIGDYGILSTSQVQRLFFTTIHKTRKRLFLLWQNNFLDRVFRPVTIGRGSSEILYILTRLGLNTLKCDSSNRNLDESVRIAYKKPSLMFLEHTLCVNNFRIALVEQSRKSKNIELVYWRYWDRPLGRVVVIEPHSSPRAEIVAIVPDATFTLRHNGLSRDFVLEMDMGTTSLTKISRKIRAYIKLFGGGVDKRIDFKNAYLLYLARKDKRVENLRQLASALEANWSSRRVYCGTVSDVLQVLPNLISSLGSAF